MSFFSWIMSFFKQPKPEVKPQVVEPPMPALPQREAPPSFDGDVSRSFLRFLDWAKRRGMLRKRPEDEPEQIYDRIRRCYIEPQIRKRIHPGEPEAAPSQMSGEGPDLYQDLNLWYTFCDSLDLDITQPPPPRDGHPGA